ncbi:glutamate-rich protein 6-like isoform X2 [Gigantopelta aegis]|uniref:glutamate-rich protein 6-like isoform X2 n=1 Tax=Gigantopelta aegis TaxID=1735272 RepID=UPI001B88AA62|nr:glutamate-rich protein 6-like isoform X2 [Gigantopelta aegis]
MERVVPSPSSSTQLSDRPVSAADSQSSKDSFLSNGRPGSARRSKPHSRSSSRKSSGAKSIERQGSGDVPFDSKAGGDGVHIASSDTEKGVKFQMEPYCQSESGSEGGVQNASDTSSVAMETPGEGNARPAIARAFRPEIDDNFSALPTRSVSFEEIRKMNLLTYDGREIVLVTTDTQTDWDWVDEAANEETQEVPSEVEVKEAPQEKVEVEEPVQDDRIVDAGPYTPYSDEFGIPIMNVSSDSEDSSDGESWRKQQENRDYLPSIGPPQILQYLREADKPQEGKGDDLMDELGLFGGICEFCGQQIKPFPSVERQQELPPDELYCCDQYREFVEFATTTAFDLELEVRKQQRMISVKPHAHFGTKKDRKAAKERAVQRMRDRELQRRKQEAEGMQSSLFSPGPSAHERGGAHPSGRAGHGAKAVSMAPSGMSNFAASQFRGGPMGPMGMDVTRQMKTINYQLSSQRCLDEGWTLRCPTPLMEEEEVCEVFIPEPLIESGKLVDRPLIQKYYENGQKFLTIFSDGSGNVFYPSGQLAIAITSVSLGLYLYIVHDDTPKHNVTAIFEPNGYGSCFHGNGIVRVYFDQLGGMELDTVGARKRKWTWRDPEVHVHAPPFQPICFGLNHNLGVRIMSQDNIILSMTAKKCSCRFNVGSKLKLVAPENLPPKEIDETQLFLSEKSAYVENVLHKVATLLKFPKSPKLDKILPPIHLSAKMQRNEKLRKERETTTSGNKSRITLPSVKVN